MANIRNGYTAESIESLDFIDHIRRYVGMYIGSKTIDGLHHCIKEIVSNGIDEYLNGSGDTIRVVLQEDGGIFIADNARGIPHGEHSEGVSVLQACFGMQNTGGKFNNDTGETGYNTSGGSHGTGAKAVNALSTKMIVTTSREGKKETVEFAKGQFVSHKEQECPIGESGVSVLFYPDPEVLEEIKPNANHVKQMLREFSYLCSGLTFIFTVDGVTEEFYSDRGLLDYLEYLSKGSLITKPFHFNEADGLFQVEVAFGYDSSYSHAIKLYTNNIPQDKGTHLTGFKTALTSTINSFAKEKGWLKEKDANLTGGDLEEGQILIINFKMINPVYKGQSKEELTSSEGRTYVQKLSSIALKRIFERNEKEVKKIVEKALGARKAKEAAKKAKDRARGINNNNGKKLKAMDLPTKLVDAGGKDRTLCELFITEGDSAGGGIIEARNAMTQGVLPIRGKIIATRTATTEKILANAEINSIIKALGLKMDEKGKLIYDKKKLRYDKILAACDGDSDGSHIQNLLLQALWWLCPDLIINGHFYVLAPPLYRVTEKGNKYVYLRDDAALEEYKKTHQGQKYKINRNKGLGEQDTEELEYCLVNPETRDVAQVVVENIEEGEALMECLFGKKVEGRKEFLEQFGEEARD